MAGGDDGKGTVSGRLRGVEYSQRPHRHGAGARGWTAAVSSRLRHRLNPFMDHDMLHAVAATGMPPLLIADRSRDTLQNL
jgi:hypothetical protein